MNDDIPIGPTGRFPDGQIGDDDEGELAAALGVKRGRVVIDFGKPVSWLSLPPAAARDLAVKLIRFAGRADGRPFTLEL